MIDLPKPPTPVKIRKKTGPSESDIEDAVCRYARSKGFLALKFTSPNRRSVPDRIFLGHYQIIFFIEFKAPGKKVTEKQAREIERLEGLGFRVGVIDDEARGKALIDFME